MSRAHLAEGLETQLQELRRLRTPRRVAEIAFFTLLWIAGIAAGGSAGVAASAVALNAFFLLSHEGHHNLLFRPRAVNRWVNVLICIPLLHSPAAYRVLHELHHRHLGGPGDPDDFRNYSRNPRVVWALHWVRLTIGTLVYMPLIPLVAWRRAGPEDRRRIACEYALLAAVLAPLFALVPMRTLAEAWLIPGVIVGYISAVRALAQHALTPGHDPLLASRSVRSNPIVSFLLLNENYHLEHHLFPEVPSYNLPRLRALLRPRLTRAVEARSYSRFLASFIARFLRGDDSPLGWRGAS